MPNGKLVTSLSGCGKNTNLEQNMLNTMYSIDCWVSQGFEARKYTFLKGPIKVEIQMPEILE